MASHHAIRAVPLRSGGSVAAMRVRRRRQATRPEFGRGHLEQTFVVRPTGVERADAINIRIPIEGANYDRTALGA